MLDSRQGAVGLYLDCDVDSLDREIMRHIANEIAKLLKDGMSDLDEYGSGVKYFVNCDLAFIDKEVFEDGR